MVADRPARVGVNLLWLVPGVVGGSEEYTTRLLAGIAEQRPDDFDIVLFANRALASAYPDLVDAFPTVVAPLDGDRKWQRVAAESSWLARAARRGACRARCTMPAARSRRSARHRRS